ncbi:MAG: hypothetical protein AB7F40_10985 [Victivallaceae bacterium]
MSDNNEFLKGIPTPKSAEDSAPATTDTGNVPKVEADDTRTRKTVKLSAAGMMPNLNKLRPEDLAVAKPTPSAPPVGGAAPMGAPDSPTVRLRPVGGAIPTPGAHPTPAAAPAAGTDTGNVPKQNAAEDTRTRRTVRITAASVEDTVKLQRGAAPAAPSAPAAPEAPAAPTAEAPKPKLSIPKPAAPASAPAAPTASAAAPAAPAEAGAPATGRVRREKAQLNLVKEAGPAKGPSRVEKDMAAIAGNKVGGGSNEVSPVYTVIAAITLLALIATVVFSSQYLNIWQPQWADGFTILPSASESK